MALFTIGQFVVLDGTGIGVVVMLSDGTNVPDDHIGVWFGGLTDSGNPVVCTVPADYFGPAPDATIQH